MIIINLNSLYLLCFKPEYHPVLNKYRQFNIVNISNKIYLKYGKQILISHFNFFSLYLKRKWITKSGWLLLSPFCRSRKINPFQLCFLSSAFLFKGKHRKKKVEGKKSVFIYRTTLTRHECLIMYNVFSNFMFVKKKVRKCFIFYYIETFLK